MALQRARIQNVSFPDRPPIEVMFNPTEYAVDQGAEYAEHAIPGLAMPLLQFVKGTSRTMSLELLLDGTRDRTSVIERLDQLRALVQIDGELHAPPVCRFVWGATSFQAVALTMRENYTLFRDDGTVVRARVTLALRSYEPIGEQLERIRPSSPDRTRVRVLRAGERLTDLAAEAYGDATLWTRIAEANDIDRPRFVPPGTALRIPAL